jgi:hypothetical protein
MPPPAFLFYLLNKHRSSARYESPCGSALSDYVRVFGHGYASRCARCPAEGPGQTADYRCHSSSSSHFNAGDSGFNVFTWHVDWLTDQQASAVLSQQLLECGVAALDRLAPDIFAVELEHMRELNGLAATAEPATLFAKATQGHLRTYVRKN